MNPEWKNRYEAAVEATRQAGQAALRYFDTTFEVEWKQDESPVTVADREAERTLKGALEKAFPQDGFLGEEYGNQPGTSGYRWIIDPIDATRNFVRGIPIWGTLLGLEYQGELIAGVIEVPAQGHCYRALRGDGAYRDDRRIQVSSVSRLEDSTIFYTGLRWLREGGAPEIFEEICQRSQVQRGYGDFYGYMLIAQGSGELMFEHGVHPWDVAAVIPILEEAGGKLTTWDGTQSIDRPDVIATNGKVHEEILRIVQSHQK